MLINLHPLILLALTTILSQPAMSLPDRKDIDLIILDIEMPEMNGFDFIGSLDFPPNIIIVSAGGELCPESF